MTYAVRQRKRLSLPPFVNMSPFVTERRQVNEAHRLKPLRRYVSSPARLGFISFLHTGVPGITPLRPSHLRYLPEYLLTCLPRIRPPAEVMSFPARHPLVAWLGIAKLAHGYQAALGRR